MNASRVIRIVATCILLVLVGWAFMLVGTPDHNRAVMEDHAKAEAASCLACMAQEYACNHEGQFPADEAALQDYMKTAGKRWCSHDGLNCGNQRIFDESISEYQYRADGTAGYSLCIDMHEDADDKLSQPRGFYSPAMRWPDELKNYKSGKQCISFKTHTCPKTNTK